MSSCKQKVCLIVIDGWGISDDPYGNAILNAKVPHMDRLIKENSTEIEAHGDHVGLPAGLMGNSEVGHLNIGAGRVIVQDIDRINNAVLKDELKTNKAFVAACNNAKAKTKRLHLMGLVSDGGVHSHIDHLFGLIKAAKALGVPKLFIHFFSDGRDTSPTSGVGYLQQLMDFLNKEKYGQIALIVGRYYAMDRDKRWERMQIAYEAMVAGKGDKVSADKVVDFIKTHRYAADETDEFLKPIVINEEGCVKDDDTLVFFDYRSDRMRQVTETFGLKRNFETTITHPKNLHISCMTQYKKEYPFPLIFEPQLHKNVLAEWISSKGLTQFHCAETEKYPHVTFFFNGGREIQFEHEDRHMTPSPKVKTYDLKPEMSCLEVAQKMVDEIKTKKYPFIMCNFAPPDMVGHTGIYEAAVLACEATDKAIHMVEEACRQNGYILMITADHGNAEKMYDDKGGKHTAHTCYRVPFISTGKRRFAANPNLGGRPAALCDVAPTVLDEMGLDIPPEMTGRSLLEP